MAKFNRPGAEGAEFEIRKGKEFDWILTDCEEDGGTVVCMAFHGWADFVLTALQQSTQPDHPAPQGEQTECYQCKTPLPMPPNAEPTDSFLCASCALGKKSVEQADNGELVKEVQRFKQYCVDVADEEGPALMDKVIAALQPQGELAQKRLDWTIEDNAQKAIRIEELQNQLAALQQRSSGVTKE